MNEQQEMRYLNIHSLTLEIGKFDYGYLNISVDFPNRIIHWQHSLDDFAGHHFLTTKELQSFIHIMQKCKIDTWDDEYRDDEVFDGETWELVLKMNDEIIRKSGVNAYPDTWMPFKEVMHQFVIIPNRFFIYQGEDILNRLLVAWNTRNLMKFRHCLYKDSKMIFNNNWYDEVQIIALVKSIFKEKSNPQYNIEQVFSRIIDENGIFISFQIVRPKNKRVLYRGLLVLVKVNDAWKVATLKIDK